MLLWINGPFGGGKTQTAYELRRRLPGSVVCDPEHVGFGLHRTLPPALRGDFQDLPAWRQGVRDMLDLALRGHPGTVIAPMTLVDAGYFAEIVGRLREDGHPVHHFALLAERATVLRRLSERGLGRGPRTDRRMGGGVAGLGTRICGVVVNQQRSALPQSSALQLHAPRPAPSPAPHAPVGPGARASPSRNWTTAWSGSRARSSPSTSVPTG
ncbi:AAA family ATPase [Streptomyces sp. NBC_00464]|uniref:AAA family ATPase n=1 Tax=Streptomyces sp. NBC_00464 TaxID=2975751 RepID=UPI002E19C52C